MKEFGADIIIAIDIDIDIDIAQSLYKSDELVFCAG